MAVSDILVTTKSCEIQRGMVAELRGDQERAARHMLAAAHLELVLAGDYAEVGDAEMVVRSRISAGSCFWRGGNVDRARQVLEEVVHDHPERAKAVQSVIDDLKSHSETRSL